MSEYAQAARYYDILYSGKDYQAEARLLVDVIRERCPRATSILDVGCGTGTHARHLIDAGFAVDGIDVEPQFVTIAQEKCPEGNFTVGDMRSFELNGRYDAVVSLFSAIGYVRNEDGLDSALHHMAAHMNPGGVVVVDPWFEPGALTHNYIMTVEGQGDGVSVVRMSRTVLEGALSRLEFEYLAGSEAGIERLREVHELGLFTQAQMESAFHAAGLRVDRLGEALRTRGMYVGQVGIEGRLPV